MTYDRARTVSAVTLTVVGCGPPPPSPKHRSHPRPKRSRERIRHAAIGWLVAVLLLLHFPAEAGEKSLTVRLQDGQISMLANDVPLGEILSEIRQATGIEIHIDAALEEKVLPIRRTIALSGVPLETALRRLLPDAGSVFLYQGTKLSAVAWYGAGGRPPGKFAVAAGRQRAVPAAKAAASPDASDSPSDDDPARTAELVKQALGAPEPGERIKALEELSLASDERVILDTALQTFATERDPEVLDVAFDLFKDVESAPIEPLIQLIRTASQLPELRIRALDVLAERGLNDPRVIELLRVTASRDASPELRRNASAFLRETRRE
jgi:hypothetical protein